MLLTAFAADLLLAEARAGVDLALEVEAAAEEVVAAAGRAGGTVFSASSPSSNPARGGEWGGVVQPPGLGVRPRPCSARRKWYSASRSRS